MKLKFILIIFLGVIQLQFYAQSCGSKQTITDQKKSEIEKVILQLSNALLKENKKEIDSLNKELINTFNNEGGKPDAVETYYQLTNNTTWLDLEQTLILSRALITKDSIVYQNLWKVGKGIDPKINKPNSIFLRASAEVAVGLLKIASKETDLNKKNNYTFWATRALDSLATMQLENGAYPFPDLRPYKDPVFSPIINNYLGSLGKDSSNVLKNGWIIDDNNTGEFKFDAGVIANAYYEAFLLTNQLSYRENVIKIANYMLSLKANTNYNYNTFVSLALTRAFQLTSDTSYLNRAIYNLRYGVLPGQTNSGRWVDGHNANSRYHNLMIYNISPTISLIPSNNPYKEELFNMYSKAIQNLYTYTAICGSSTGFRWLTPIYKLAETDIEKINTKELQDLLGKYINQSNNNGKYLDIQSLGEYIEILDKKTLSISTITKFNPSIIRVKNLSNEKLQITLDLTFPEKIKIEIISLDGKNTLLITNEFYPPGEQTFEFNKQNLSQGQYILKVKGNSIESSQLIFIE